ncbi:hypothetical protein FSP39_001106 [Pinctada imbricata]|uniref:Uncharacterized protein n=1 Tax=Pinctada imbricata TaxID=66713 RepID=A0AA88XP49_PINIB|nr:hypothetical protein FSP39_001106 [Pinctada imbricata]
MKTKNKDSESVPRINWKTTYSASSKRKMTPAISYRIATKKPLQRTCDEALRWLDNNSLAEVEEYEYKLKEVQKVCSPLMSKLHGGQQYGHQTGQPGGAAGGPTVEEVD